MIRGRGHPDAMSADPLDVTALRRLISTRNLDQIAHSEHVVPHVDMAPPLADEARQTAEVACDRAVSRICRDQQWWSAFGKRRGKNGKKPGPPAHDNRVRRDFAADRPRGISSLAPEVALTSAD